MGYNPSHFSADGSGKPGVKYPDASKPAGGKDSAKGQDTGDFPVENVSWDEAVAFCQKLSALPAERASRRAYRLPTEAEWEYACRAGTTTPFNVGRILSIRRANFWSSPQEALRRTCKVGSYEPNAWGLYDMHGNVFEWCADWFDKDYYGKSPQKDPPGPASGSRRVLRGGSFTTPGAHCRSAQRPSSTPSERGRFRGFRVAGVLPGQ
jgi:formylglycine-generating enzyme required for sulfatase activity